MNLKDCLKNKFSENKQVEVDGRTNVEKNRKFTKEERKILEDFREFREGFKSPAAEAMANHFAKIRNVNLDDKVDNFIDWYFKNMVKGHYNDIGEFHKPKDMRNFIEKMAVLYELRYPDYEINRLMSSSSQETIKVNDVMFDGNKNINELFEEETYLLEPRYSDLINEDICLKLTSTGIIQDVELNSMELLLNDNERRVIEKEFKGKHVEELVKFLKEKVAKSDVYENLKKITVNYNKQLYQRDEMLNCVMYRIIERGGNRIGPRRAFLFAKEFGRNIDIPMMYAIDYSDPELRLFINEYLKSGGTKDLMCYIGYFSRTNEMQKLDTISIQDLILTQNNNAATFYTPEETAIHQRIVNVLASQVDQDELRKEEVKQLRLQRK